jgi:phosphoribosylglycinamide formyltransferase-1
MGEQLISEKLTPITSENAQAIIIGAPLLPVKFVWRGDEYVIGEVLETWKETGSCTHGSGERYVRKHWFHVRTTQGEEMKIYFERKARSTRQAKQRWWLYTFKSSS